MEQRVDLVTDDKRMQRKLKVKYVYETTRDAGTGGKEGQLPPLPFTRRGKGGKGALSI